VCLQANPFFQVCLQANLEVKMSVWVSWPKHLAISTPPKSIGQL
jgi:hypothetical protein